MYVYFFYPLQLRCTMQVLVNEMNKQWTNFITRFVILTMTTVNVFTEHTDGSRTGWTRHGGRAYGLAGLTDTRMATVSFHRVTVMIKLSKPFTRVGRHRWNISHSKSISFPLQNFSGFAFCLLHKAYFQLSKSAREPLFPCTRVAIQNTKNIANN